MKQEENKCFVCEERNFDRNCSACQGKGFFRKVIKIPFNMCRAYLQLYKQYKAYKKDK